MNVSGWKGCGRRRMNIVGSVCWSGTLLQEGIDGDEHGLFKFVAEEEWEGPLEHIRDGRIAVRSRTEMVVVEYMPNFRYDCFLSARYP
jgi:hypothetical protein